MKKILMYPHGGSGNHGCEAIVRGTQKILNIQNKAQYTLFSSNILEDKQVGLEKICNLEKDITSIKRISLDYMKAFMKTRLFKDKDAYDCLAYKNVLESCNEDTIALSIGGDNYCYGSPKHIYFLNKYIRKNNAKNVLWGCSVEPSAIDDEMAQDLAEYDKIIARESITYKALKPINPNTVLCPDPAFQLDKIELELPDRFLEKNTVGINVSPMIIGYEKNQGVTLENYKRLMEYILQQTDMNIALIPHVCWSHNDDRKPLKQLYELYSDTKRVVLIEEHNCMELKGFIARCRFFVGARTHATIAAYSSCVPTLVVGYSVKARGIAKDIFGTEERYVIPVQNLTKEEDLAEAFQWLMDNEDGILMHFKEKMPEYCGRALKAGEELKEL